jgi:hypothetical protein
MARAGEVPASGANLAGARSLPPKPARAVHSRNEVSAGAQHLAVFLTAIAEVPVGRGAKEQAEALIVASGIPKGPDAMVHTQPRGSTAKGPKQHPNPAQSATATSITCLSATATPMVRLSAAWAGQRSMT